MGSIALAHRGGLIPTIDTLYLSDAHHWRCGQAGDL